MCVGLEDSKYGLYVRGWNEMLLKGLKKVGIVKTENLMEKEDFKKNIKNELKNKWYKKRMYEQFVREMPEETDKDLSWIWLVQSANRSNDICCTRTSIKDKLYKE